MGKVQLLQDNHSLTAAEQTAVKKKEPERDKCYLKRKDFHIIILQ